MTVFSSVYRRISSYTTRRYTTVIRSHVIRLISPYTVVYDRACLTWVVSVLVVIEDVGKLRARGLTINWADEIFFMEQYVN
jgi:hypothetical protein